MLCVLFCDVSQNAVVLGNIHNVQGSKFVQGGKWKLDPSHDNAVLMANLILKWWQLPVNHIQLIGQDREVCLVLLKGLLIEKDINESSHSGP